MSNYETRPVPQAINWQVTREAFRARFSMQEKVFLYTAAQSVVALRVYLDDLANASRVDLSSPVTLADLQRLEQTPVPGVTPAVNVLAVGRAAEICGTPPLPNEN